jgi:pimeloyl-ACP methyl ester carboxylesterase
VAIATFARMGWRAARGKHADAAEIFLRWAYAYRDGGSAWDAFPEEWRRLARDNAKATLVDIAIAGGDYIGPKELGQVTVPIVCTYGDRSAPAMVRVTRSLAEAIPGVLLRGIAGAGHAAAFDAPEALAQAIVEADHSAGS